MPDTASAQLRRILAVIPELADDREHRLDEVSAKIGVDADTLLKDLESLVTRFDDPGGFVDGLQLYVAGETVSLVSNHFRRPMRPTISELRALELGLTMLRTEVPPDERSSIESAREKIRKTIAKLPSDESLSGDRYAESEHPGSVAHLSALRDAMRSHKKVALDYLKPNTDEVSKRVLRPYSLVISSGAWYVIGYCELTESLRIFRLDRIAAAVILDEEYDVPDSFRVSDILAAHKAFGSPAAPRMRVRYSARIAPWIAEREEGKKEDDGSLVVDHPLADPDWGVRNVLQYGPEAEIIEPKTMRAAIQARLTHAAAAFDR